MGDADPGSAPPAKNEGDWSPRETQILQATLRLLQERGYDGLAVHDVAAAAHASKTTLYRRWPTKAELVLAAVSVRINQVAVPPRTGSLRGDLVELGRIICRQSSVQVATMRATLVEASHNPALQAAIATHVLNHRKAVIAAIIDDAVVRGEVDEAVVVDELWDVFPGYLIFRGLVGERPPTERTVEAFVDTYILPGLLRRSHES